MAITQISKITHRKGLNENLPQLAGAELGWALDARRLFIGNGTIAAGAPTIGNTEVLTQYSDILQIASTYTYKGTATGYEVLTGPTTTTPVTRTLQAKFDDNASVRDFGAKGDGVTDDTLAINRALSELYTREVNSEIRRSLFFPAGTYKVTDTIKVPPYAKLYGEGAKSSTIKYYNSGVLAEAVVRTSDSKNQTGANIGNFSAVAPTDIEISSMGFESTATNDIFLLESTTNSSFENVSLKGPETTLTLTASDSKACIRIKSTTLLASQNITFNNCVTNGTGYGIQANSECSAITLSNSKISTHYIGASIGDTPTNNGPSGVRITQNVFDNILAQGILIGKPGETVSKNISAFNIFYDVGNKFGGNAAPLLDMSTIIEIENANNLSVGDMFERSDSQNALKPRIHLNESASIAFDLSNKIEVGTYVREVGKIATLADNTLSATAVFTFDLEDSNTLVDIGSFKMDYALKRGGIARTGTINITNAGSGTLTYDESYTENSASGVVFTVTQALKVVTVKYTTTNTGNNATLSYSLTRLY
jgi:hypothetical protein